MRKTPRKLLTMALVGTTIISMTGITAFAAEDTNETVHAEAWEEDVTVEAGNVNVTVDEDADYIAGVEAYSSEHNATATTGSISVTGTESSWTTGVDTSASKEGKTDVTVNGDVTVDSGEDVTGIYTDTWNQGDVSVDITGDVFATGKYVEGVQAYGSSASSTEVSIGGNVIATSTGTDEERQATGVMAVPRGDATIKIDVKGDVKADNIGVQVYGESENMGKADIVVGGVISAEDIGIFFEGPETVKNTSLTVWKIDLNEEGEITDGVEFIDDEETGETEVKQLDTTDFEKTIHYIIKLEQPTEGGVLSTEGTETVAGYDTAKEGETVLLKVNVKDGYRLAAAYNGKDQKLALKQDKDGNYYIIVPKGGGVLLSAVLEKIEEEENSADTTGTKDEGTVEKQNDAPKKAAKAEQVSVSKKAEKANVSKKDSTVVTESTNTKVEAPQTNDASQAAWIIILAASLTGLVVVRRNRKGETA